MKHLIELRDNLKDCKSIYESLVHFSEFKKISYYPNRNYITLHGVCMNKPLNFDLYFNTMNVEIEGVVRELALSPIIKNLGYIRPFGSILFKEDIQEKAELFKQYGINTLYSINTYLYTSLDEALEVCKLKSKNPLENIFQIHLS